MAWRAEMHSLYETNILSGDKVIATIHGEGVGEEAAYARLIAAAPDLLDAALNYLDGDDCQLDHEGFCQSHGVSKPCRQQTLRAAVRKAQGRDA